MISKLGNMLTNFIMQSFLDSAYPFPRVWWNIKERLNKTDENKHRY